MTIHTAPVPDTGDSWSVARHGELVFHDGQLARMVQGLYEVTHPDTPEQIWIASYEELRRAGFGRQVGMGCSYRADLDIVYGPSGEKLPIVQVRSGSQHGTEAAATFPDGCNYLMRDVRTWIPAPGTGWDDSTDDEEEDDHSGDEGLLASWRRHRDRGEPDPEPDPEPRRRRRMTYMGASDGPRGRMGRS